MRLVPHVTFIIGNLVARQHASELILKAVATIMFGLVPDVATQRSYLGEADRECSIAALPCKRRKRGIPFLIPKQIRTQGSAGRATLG
jgi:hypothetical protein